MAAAVQAGQISLSMSCIIGQIWDAPKAQFVQLTNLNRNSGHLSGGILHCLSCMHLKHAESATFWEQTGYSTFFRRLIYAYERGCSKSGLHGYSIRFRSPNQVKKQEEEIGFLNASCRYLLNPSLFKQKGATHELLRNPQPVLPAAAPSAGLGS